MATSISASISGVRARLQTKLAETLESSTPSFIARPITGAPTNEAPAASVQSHIIVQPAYEWLLQR